MISDNIILTVAVGTIVAFAVFMVARLTSSVTRCEERLWNVSVLQRIRL
jgi:hypothetical protein